MQLDRKKLIQIILFSLISVGLIVLIVILFFTGGEETQPTDITGTGGGALPISGTGITPGTGTGTQTGGAGAVTPGTRPSDVAQGGLTTVLPVTESRVISPKPARGGDGISYYDARDGYFYRIAADGKKVRLTDEKFFGVESVSWSGDGNKAVIEYPDGANILYDFNQKRTVSLPKEVIEPQFSPISDTIAFKTDSSDPNNNWLVISNANTGQTDLIQPLSTNGDSVQVAISPSEQVVAFFSTPVSSDQSDIFLIGKNDENFKSFTVNGLNFKGKYSPDGVRVLYHVVSPNDGYRPSLWIVDGTPNRIGQNNIELGLNTWIDKCTFNKAGRIVYCAVPQSLAEGSGLAEGTELTTIDEFYRVDLETGLKALIARPALEDEPTDVSVVSTWLSEDENDLYFYDYKAEKVFKMRVR